MALLFVVLHQRVGMSAMSSFLTATKTPHQQKVVDGNLDIDYNKDDDEEDKNTSANTIKKKETASTKFIQLFTEQSDDTIALATSFTYKCPKQK
eukprot:13101324-Ditylum_brightwellii.AAC.1